MHLSNECIDPIMPLSNSIYLSEGDEHGNNNWRNDIHGCIANRNLFIRFLAKGRVENDQFQMEVLRLLHMHTLVETDFSDPLIPPMGYFKGTLWVPSF